MLTTFISCTIILHENVITFMSKNTQTLSTDKCKPCVDVCHAGHAGHADHAEHAGHAILSYMC